MTKKKYLHDRILSQLSNSRFFGHPALLTNVPIAEITILMKMLPAKLTVGAEVLFSLFYNNVFTAILRFKFRTWVLIHKFSDLVYVYIK